MKKRPLANHVPRLSAFSHPRTLPRKKNILFYTRPRGKSEHRGANQPTNNRSRHVIRGSGARTNQSTQKPPRPSQDEPLPPPPLPPPNLLHRFRNQRPPHTKLENLRTVGAWFPPPPRHPRNLPTHPPTHPPTHAPTRPHSGVSVTTKQENKTFISLRFCLEVFFYPHTPCLQLLPHDSQSHFSHSPTKSALISWAPHATLSSSCAYKGNSNEQQQKGGGGATTEVIVEKHCWGYSSREFRPCLSIYTIYIPLLLMVKTKLHSCMR